MEKCKTFYLKTIANVTSAHNTFYVEKCKTLYLKTITRDMMHMRNYTIFYKGPSAWNNMYYQVNHISKTEGTKHHVESGFLQVLKH
jgi:hypothetical protein